MIMSRDPLLPNFEDFDDQDVSAKVEAYILDADARNLVIEFDIDTAIAASGIRVDAFQELLKEEVLQPCSHKLMRLR